MFLFLFNSIETYSQLFRPKDSYNPFQTDIQKRGPLVRYEYEYKSDNEKTLDSTLISQISYDSGLKKIEEVYYENGVINRRITFTYKINLLVKLIEEKYTPFLLNILHEINYDSSGNPNLEKSQSTRTSNNIRYKYKYNNNQLESIHQSDNNGDFYLAKEFEYKDGKLRKSQTYSQLGKEQAYFLYEWESENQRENTFEVKGDNKKCISKDFYEDGLLKTHTNIVRGSVIDHTNQTIIVEEYFITETYKYDKFHFLQQIEISKNDKVVGLRKFFYE